MQYASPDQKLYSCQFGCSLPLGGDRVCILFAITIQHRIPAV